MRKFEKIGKSEFLKDVPDANYDDIILPKRSTLNSAGYDFYSVISFTLSPGERRVIPTGIKASMDSNEFLSIYIRSSLGFKWNIRMCNQVGIIDADYYNNSENEGHIFVKMTNDCNGGKVLELKAGASVCQGIFLPFGITFDDNATARRNGGLGSTSK